jgi:hypothetical protein
MLINSSELRDMCFNLKEVIPSTLETSVFGGLWTRGTGLRNLEDMDPERFVCQWMMTLNSGHDVSE